MSWKSKAQERWGNSEAGEKALGGEKAVHEWNEATKGKKLPSKIKGPMHEKHDMAPHISRVTKKDAD